MKIKKQEILLYFVMLNKIKYPIGEALKIVGLYNPIRKLYNLLTLFNSKMIVSVYENEAIFITPTNKIKQDLEAFYGEREFLEMFLSEIKINDVVWDIGASCGVYSIFSAMRAVNGKVYAFEPERSAFRMLMKNLKLNNLNNIVALQVALMEKSGECFLYTSKSANIGTHSLIKRIDYPVSSKGKLIKTYSGDELVENKKIDFPDAIKIDVEGSEVFVLQGIKKILSSDKIRILQIEIHPEILTLLNINECYILSLIEKFDFDIVKKKIRGSEIELFCKKK